MIPKILHFRTISSTNRVAYCRAQTGEMHGAVVLALQQTEGRGRLGKTWQSPEGCGLYFSIILRPGKLVTEDFAKITLAAGLGVSQALEAITGKPTGLKWPNDVYLNGKKCSGILAESSPLHDLAGRFVILGVGVNVLNRLTDFPEDLQQRATSLLCETGKKYTLQYVLGKVYGKVMLQFNLLENGGFQGILRQWKKRDILRNRWIEWLTNSGDIVYGVADGPSDDGLLCIRDRNGEKHLVISGDIRLAAEISQKKDRQPRQRG